MRKMEAKLDNIRMNGCSVINIFQTKENVERKRKVQNGLANIICRSESAGSVKYIRVK